MTKHEGEASGIENCLLCSGDYPAEFVETITSALTAIGVEMSLDAFREWLMDQTCAFSRSPRQR